MKAPSRMDARGGAAPEPAARTGFSLLGDPSAAAEARERLAAGCRGLSRPATDLAQLLLTELVTNAARHGGARNGTPMDVTIDRSTARLRVAVTDPGPGFEWRARDCGRPLAEGGYGLVLVDRLAECWGIDRGESSTTVWFELSHG
jgi:anti-sigma regulatory factor (Ser/Thr protein kinase)